MSDLYTIDQPHVIGEFFGEYRFLSNFAQSRIVWRGLSWPTVEHAYQAAKSTDPAVQEQIRQLATPGFAKRAGKIVQLRPDWEDVKVSIMTELVWLKFTQNPHLAAKLLNTGDAILEEGNTWNDRFWGICPPRSGIGENYLGWILMVVRDRLAAV